MRFGRKVGGFLPMGRLVDTVGPPLRVDCHG